MIKPYFTKDSVVVVYSTDENYIPLLSVAIQSVIANSSVSNNYDIIVIHEGIKDNLYQNVCSLADRYENISIRFFDISENLKKYDESLFYTHWHFSKAAYYRLFIPEFLQEFSKILYLDCDTVVKKDVADLYNIDLKNNYASAVNDIGILMSMFKKRKKDLNYSYMKKNILGIKNWEEYFQSAVMVLNIDMLSKIDFTNLAIKTLERIKKPRFVEQDILNVIFEGHVLPLDWRWNFNQTHCLMELSLKKAKKVLPKKYQEKYAQAVSEPYIYHYTWKKPYEFDKIYEGQEPFWEYAMQSHYYDYFIQQKKLLESKKRLISISKYLSFVKKIKCTCYWVVNN